MKDEEILKELKILNTRLESIDWSSGIIMLIAAVWALFQIFASIAIVSATIMTGG